MSSASTADGMVCGVRPPPRNDNAAPSRAVAPTAGRLREPISPRCPSSEASSSGAMSSGRLALLGQIDHGDVAELLDGELGDADGGHVALETRPLVLLRVAKVAGILVAHVSSLLWTLVKRPLDDFGAGRLAAAIDGDGGAGL